MGIQEIIHNLIFSQIFSDSQQETFKYYNMIDQNTLFYTFSTMAQSFAGITAFTAIFVSAKSNEYRTKMQREMRNVVNEFDLLLNDDGWLYRYSKIIEEFFKGSKSTTSQWHKWRTQAKSAEDHGVLVEMRDIFKCHSERSELKSMKQACVNGLFNYDSHVKLIYRYVRLVYFSLFLIAVDLLCIAFTSECNVQQHYFEAYLILSIVIGLAIIFLFFMALYIYLTTKEEKAGKR